MISPPRQRVLDTRTGAGTGGTIAPVAANGQLQLDLSGKVPAGTAAVVMNVTVTQPQRAGFLTVYPAGQPRPLASNLNFSAGETVPNLVTVAGGNGKFSYYNNSPGSLQLVIDEYGYYIVAS